MPGDPGRGAGVAEVRKRRGVEPTNDAAEQAPRGAVIKRKKSFGNDSAAGREYVARLYSVAQTLRRGAVVLTTSARLSTPTVTAYLLLNCLLPPERLRSW